MRIRPIQPDELPVFAGAATHSEYVGAVHDYVSDLLIKGSMRTEWCYVAESRGQEVARAAFWTWPKMNRPRLSRSIGGLEISHAHPAPNGYKYLDSNQ